MVMIEFFTVVAIPAVVVVWAIATYLQRRQQPLSSFSKTDMEVAFRFAPEKCAEFVSCGSMSRYEFVELQKLNLRRIDEELKRRSEQ